MPQSYAATPAKAVLLLVSNNGSLSALGLIPMQNTKTS